jgi:ferredoxin-thioredoxin reductase catalytic subunit
MCLTSVRAELGVRPCREMKGMRRTNNWQKINCPCCKQMIEMKKCVKCKLFVLFTSAAVVSLSNTRKIDQYNHMSKRTSKKNVDGRCTSSHENKTFRNRSVVKQKGMLFGFRKTATAVTRPERQVDNHMSLNCQIGECSHRNGIQKPTFRVCRSVHLHTFEWINQLDAAINYRFIVCRLDAAQHVSGIPLPIIRSLSTAAASGLP